MFIEYYLLEDGSYFSEEEYSRADEYMYGAEELTVMGTVSIPVEIEEDSEEFHELMAAALRS